jgi:Ni,Fe-hydrogenase III small subunit
MLTALSRTYEAAPEPRVVVAVGDCGRDGGIFGCSYASRGGVSTVVAVDMAVPECPHPQGTPPGPHHGRHLVTIVQRRPAQIFVLAPKFAE